MQGWSIKSTDAGTFITFSREGVYQIMATNISDSEETPHEHQLTTKVNWNTQNTSFCVFTLNSRKSTFYTSNILQLDIKMATLLSKHSNFPYLLLLDPQNLHRMGHEALTQQWKWLTWLKLNDWCWWLFFCK